MINQKKISVALTTYNGIKYLEEQLDSLRTQTLKPDEVIIADDNSSDGTPDFCEKYIAQNNLTGWKVIRREKNLGVVENFRQVILQTTGDYIFTCDQDDIWKPEKIQVMCEVLEARPEIKLLASNYIPLINNEPAHVPVKYIERDDGKIIKYELKNTWLDSLRPGCCFCFRRELLDVLEIFAGFNNLYDSLLWQRAITSDGLYLLCRRLIIYRRHEGNATGQFNRPLVTIERRIELCRKDSEWYEGILKRLNMPEKNQRLLKKKINFIERRSRMLAKKNLFRAVIFVALNFNYYPTFRNAMSEICAMIFR